MMIQSRDHDPLGPHPDQVAAALQFLLDVVAGGGQDQGVAVLLEPPLKGGDETREDGMLDPGNGRPDDTGPAGGQRPRGGMGVVTEAMRGAFDEFPGLRAHRIRAVENPRHRGDGIARSPGDFSDAAHRNWGESAVFRQKEP